MSTDSDNMGGGASCSNPQKHPDSQQIAEKSKVLKIIHFNDVYNIEVRIKFRVV